MRKSNLQILAVLAVAMHFMVQITPLWMPKLDGSGQTIQICTSQGIETYTFDENGVPLKTPDNSRVKAAHDCPFCIAHAASSLTPHAVNLRLPVDINRAQSVRRATGIDLKPSHFTAANQTRGPPAYS